jgi:hypothetical protein
MFRQFDGEFDYGVYISRGEPYSLHRDADLLGGVGAIL